MSKLLPYLIAFGGGFFGSHFYRSKGPATMFNVPDVPGDTKSVKTIALEVGSHGTQKFAPLQGIHMHVCGFHFYNGDMNRQVEAHHFCSHLNEDFC